MEKFSGLEKFKHLNSPELAIKAGYYVGEELKDVDYENISKLREKAINIDWFATTKSATEFGCILGQGFVLSPLDRSNKESSEFFNCIGLVVVGKSNGDNISILSHATPRGIASPSEEYSDALSSHLEDVKTYCETGTIDAVVFAGELRDGLEFGDYDLAVEIIDKTVCDALGVKPQVISSPKDHRGHYGSKIFTDVVFDNENRRLHIFQNDFKLDEVTNG